jgi:hypothetical protein
MDGNYDFSMCSVADDETFIRDPKNKSFSDHQQHQQEQRLSNRDSGISSGQNQRMSEHMNRFLVDTVKSQKSGKSSSEHTKKSFVKYPLDNSLYTDGKILIKQSEAFVTLADTWKQSKPLRDRQHRSNPTSSVPQTSSDLQEGARGEINPTRFSDRLTPEVEILHDNENREERRRNVISKYEPKSQHRPRRASEIRRNHELISRPISRGRSTSMSRDTCNSSKCCHHTTVYQYNYPQEPIKYNVENISSRYRSSRKPSIHDYDNKILGDLGKMAAEVTHFKRMTKAIHKQAEEEYLPSFSPPHYAKTSYKRNVEFDSFDSGIEEPAFKKIDFPSPLTSHTIMNLLNFKKKYEFLANIAQDLFIHRKNVRNIVAEFEGALQRHADLLKRKIVRLERQLPTTYDPEFSKMEHQIDVARKQYLICTQKAKEFAAIIQRDRATVQKLPVGNTGSRMPDFDYQYRLIYEIFLN